MDVGLALCSHGTTLGKGTLRIYPSWRVPTIAHVWVELEINLKPDKQD
jgi:hypothetical protein